MSFSIRILISIFSGILLLLNFLPLLYTQFPSATFLDPFFRLTFSNVCHQDPEKLIQINHFSSMTCIRCSGIYTGTFMTSLPLLFFAFVKPLGKKPIIIGAAAIFIDVFLNYIGLNFYYSFRAFVTGILFGSVLFLYIRVGIQFYFEDRR